MAGRSSGVANAEAKSRHLACFDLLFINLGHSLLRRDMLVAHLERSTCDRFSKRRKAMKRPSNRRLPSCLLALAFLGLWGCSKSAEAPTAPTDVSITDAVKASLSADSQLNGERIEVAVNNGEVTLTGEVSSDAAHLQAYNLV
ncbi:MAG: BON domain-containing protein [Acidimicrobiia bacterium]|nr:BON domain-containing protein [Acidimicrobiia bacterium]